MKIKFAFIILSLSFILFGCETRHAAVYIERSPVVIEEPATEVVIVNSCPTRRVIVRRSPIIRHEIRRHH